MKTRIGLVCLVLASCTSNAADEHTATTSEAISDPAAYTPYPWMVQRQAFLKGCSGFRIARRWVMTALHCDIESDPPATIAFYSDASAFDQHRVAHIVGSAYHRPGTTPPINENLDGLDNTDVNGDLADIAIFQVDVDDPTWGKPVTLEWQYPGSGVWGSKVGSGAHDNIDNFVGKMLAVDDTTDSADDSGGGFRTTHQQVDHGDSGSPYYVNGRALGVASRQSGLYARYTGIAHHLDWILGVIGYKWSGGPASATGVGLTGAHIQTFVGTERSCQYACEQLGACKGYTYDPGSKGCSMVSTITGTINAPGMHYAVRWALRGGSTHVGDTVAYRRVENDSAVVQRSTSGPFHELRSITTGNGWAPTSLPVVAGSKGSAYVRSDGIDVVVYRATDNHVHEVARVNGVWSDADMFNAFGAPLASGDPIGYVRVDGVNAILYRNASNRITELRLLPTGWAVRDLHSAAGNPPNAVSDPRAYVRSDGWSSVIYRSSDNHIREIFDNGVDTIGAGDPWALSGASVGAVGVPYGYVRGDGVNAIVFRGTDGTNYELKLTSSNWVKSPLDFPGSLWPASDPVAYVRADGITAVIYRSTSGHVMELALGYDGNWHSGDLTSWGGMSPSNDPFGYVRADGVNSVVYRTLDGHVRELTMTGPGWQAWDLTVAAGDTP